MSAAPSLDRFEFHRITATPRLYAEPNDVEREDLTDTKIAAQLFAGLTAAHAELGDLDDGALAIAWDRLPGTRELRVLHGGRPVDPSVERSSAGTELPVLYPPGSRGQRMPAGRLVREWASFPVWMCCAGRSDPLWGPQGRSETTAPGRGGFEDYVAHINGGFAWLVVAQPLPTAAVDAELARLNRELPGLRRRENVESDRVALLRGEARFRELARAHAAGLWSVRILVGGTDLASAKQAARLLCSSSDLDQLPYTVRPLPGSFDLAGALAAHENATDEFAAPFTATSELVAALARPPRRELAGIRVIEPPVFDQTPERPGEVGIGVVLDSADQEVGEFSVSLDTLNRHAFVAGATGSGKSQTVRHLLEGLHGRGIPWLVIEPAKAEYARMAGRIDDVVTVIRPGDPHAAPVGLNPLEPEPGFPVQTHIDLIRALFLAAFDAEEPFPQVLAKALNRAYTNLGWNTVVGTSIHPKATPRYPRMSELREVALEVVDDIGYGREVADNVRGFVDVRIGSLALGTPGVFFEGRYPLDIGDLLRRNVVLEIEDVGNDQDKAFFIGAVLIRVFEHLRIRADGGPATLRHVTVVEEAHRLLKQALPGSPAEHGVELFAGLLAEIRAYGEGIVVAEQIPVKIAPEVVKNTALKIMHRLPAADDREFVGASMNLDDAQSRSVVAMAPGEAAVFADRMDRPIRVRVPVGEGRESTEKACGDAKIHGSAAPLTLLELEVARRLADDPRLVIWIELLVIAHLTGSPSPVPDPAWLAGLSNGISSGVLDEAIAHGIRTAVDDRYAGLAAHYQPEDLTDHLLWSVARTRRLDRSCSGFEVEWQAGRFRWADVIRTLAKCAKQTTGGPHPMTPAWKARGLVVPGDSPAEQFDQLRDDPSSWLPNRSIVFGSGTPNRLAAALSRTSRERIPVNRLREGSRFLRIAGSWPEEVLEPLLENESQWKVNTK
ncbi:ATP-binding protein [Nocardia sp. NPDC127579]|uniref:ATP-binding protein n=1 Tax=Nocardia sp. NPDC127579 TaxID=3345402 RepID=UPI00362D8DBE